MIQYLYDNDKFLDVLYHGTSLELMGDHWTVALSKQSSILRLFDSYFYKQINLAQSTFRPYKRDGQNHIVRQGVILIKILQ